MDTNFEYSGSELELFQHATNWKTYWSSRIQEFIRGDVLEVGAGIGVNIPYILNPQVTSYTAIEPDAAQASRIQTSQAGKTINVIAGQLSDLKTDQPQFDTILYIDVLEHIEHDNDEIKLATKLLRPNGNLIVLVPACQKAFSPFDKKLGHFRRYERSTLAAAVANSSLKLTKLEALDAFGLATVFVNRLILKQADPTPKQILFWDKVLVPISRITDPFTGRIVGKTLIAICQKRTE